ncbi:hypothetical protein [Pseudomonas crudilactis]|jgi:hypothetical protein|uniref:hypothetical protein n=1 Tax=Pseudomonas crudilactis TaxID=2697028 RepID=UPI0015DA586F|nr:hypothetical protein [Pseudomonas crudilactis]
MQQVFFGECLAKNNFEVKVITLFIRASILKFQLIPCRARVQVLYGFLTLSVCRAELTVNVLNIDFLFFFLAGHRVVELRAYRKLLAYFPEVTVDDAPALKVQVDLAQLP